MPWPVNYTTLSPDGKLLCIVGDERVTVLGVQESAGSMCWHCLLRLEQSPPRCSVRSRAPCARCWATLRAHLPWRASARVQGRPRYCS